MRHAVVILAVAACSPPSDGPKYQTAGATTPHRGGTLRLSVRESISSLDPTFAYDEVSPFVERLLVEPLLDYAPGSTALVPRLAERWEVDENATTFHFWLRANARYSDGTPVVAGDVKYAIERALFTADSPYAQLLADVTGNHAVIAGETTKCSGIEAPNDHELVVHLDRPNVGFLYVFAIPFTAPQRTQHVVAAGDQLRRQPLGNGPYKLVEWSEGERFVVERNDEYVGPQPAYPDRIELLEGIPRDTQFLMLEQGEIDTAYRLSGPDALWVRTQPRWRACAHTIATLNVHGARFDVTQKPFDDRRVRQAFNYAVNRDHIVKLLGGGAVPSHGILPPGVAGRDEHLAPYPHDPAKARALLADAGYPNGLSVELVTVADEEAEKLATSYRADLAEVGVDVRISVVSFSVYLSMLGKRGGAAFAYAGWLGDTPDPTNFFDVKFHSSAITETDSVNDSFYRNPALDSVLDAARAETNTAIRQQKYRDAERLLADDPPWMWGYHEQELEVSQPYVHGDIPHPVWVRDFSNVWLDLDEHGERVER